MLMKSVFLWKLSLIYWTSLENYEFHRKMYAHTFIFLLPIFNENVLQRYYLFG